MRRFWLHMSIAAAVVLALGLARNTHAAAPRTGKTPGTVAAPDSLARKGAQKTARAETVRTLDAIHIEGEIPVPQVLFITGRDYRRFRDGLGARYLTSTLDVARSVRLPARVRVVAQPSLHKEEGP